jgi:hypothetical protein
MVETTEQLFSQIEKEVTAKEQVKAKLSFKTFVSKIPSIRKPAQTYRSKQLETV